ncbi:hypothetical protein [Streptomyces sp. NPDC003483]
MPEHRAVQGNSPRPASARKRMTQALTRYGITAHADRDAGNSWLQVNIHGHGLPDAGAPVLTTYVYDFRDDTTFVDQPMEHRPGTWRVTVATGGRERVVFYGQRSDPQTATAQCAAFIAGYCSALRAGAPEESDASGRTRPEPRPSPREPSYSPPLNSSPYSERTSS